MEATGYYHYQLAYFLLENEIKVSVENPLSIKRFIQMHLSKVKTDKSDAKMICLYAQNVDVKPWKGQSKNQIECLQIIRLLSLYFKQSTAIKNKLHGEQVLGNLEVAFRGALELARLVTKYSETYYSCAALQPVFTTKHAEKYTSGLLQRARVKN